MTGRNLRFHDVLICRKSPGAMWLREVPDIPFLWLRHENEASVVALPSPPITPFQLFPHSQGLSKGLYTQAFTEYFSDSVYRQQLSSRLSIPAQCLPERRSILCVANAKDASVTAFSATQFFRLTIRAIQANRQPPVLADLFGWRAELTRVGLRKCSHPHRACASALRRPDLQ